MTPATQRQRHVLGHGLGRQQVEVLEDHADAAPQRHQPVLVQLPDIGAVDQHAAAPGRSSMLMVRSKVDLPAPLRG
ncbi:hypothetical protein WJ968_00800 [Achromobacter xylosoxidans]